MYCKSCKWFVPTKFVEWDTKEKYGHNLVREKGVRSSLEDFNRRFGYNITLVKEHDNYGRCSNNKLKESGFSYEEFANSNDQALFVDAGECPDLFVGINFGCVHFDSAGKDTG